MKVYYVIVNEEGKFYDSNFNHFSEFDRATFYEEISEVQNRLKKLPKGIFYKVDKYFKHE